MLPIVQEGDPVLRQAAAPVPEELFGTPELQKIVAEMDETLDAQLDGVALAAPQVGIPYRIFLIRYDRMEPSPLEGEPERPADLGVYINPEFVRASQRKIDMEEGCLSVRGIYGSTKRHERYTMRARDASGNVFERGGGGILAQAFQHETDHLNGILFIDHASDMREVRREDIDHEPKLS
ncbi:MAG: peptide deformylase, peptide deformylase [Parcubacteria group bacterium]|nr:peptide deformylase, peptide deformylase [Parcubacteria group bacterium]